MKRWTKKDHTAHSKKWAKQPGLVRRIQVDDAADLDELVVANWLHVEKMDRGHFFVRMGDPQTELALHVYVKRSGRVEMYLRDGEDTCPLHHVDTTVVWRSS